MADQVEIRIKRPRTDGRLTTWELLEQFASLEGRTIPNCLEQILEHRLAGRWAAFVQEKRYPGLETLP